MGVSIDTLHHTRDFTDGLNSVASVYFQNGTIVNIAKVEGTPNYKIAMQTAPHIHTNSHVIADSDHCNCYRAYDRAPQTSSGVQHYCKIVQDHLPPWMGGPKPQELNTSTKSLANMLGVLKFATETYLGAEISNATVSVPFPVGRGRVNSDSLEVSLDTAASALESKLFPPLEALSDITWEDLEAKRWKRSPYTYFSCHPDDEGFVLGIEFNEAALTATI